jgi:hypothetical protein
LCCFIGTAAYLSNPATQQILLKPIRSNIAQAFDELHTLLGKHYTPDERAAVGLPDHDSLRTLLARPFDAPVTTTTTATTTTTTTTTTTAAATTTATTTTTTSDIVANGDANVSKPSTTNEIITNDAAPSIVPSTDNNDNDNDDNDSTTLDQPTTE